ncbi:UNVERIFIED_CONTAM: hypothetical protein FO487_05835 [Bacillus amyloliquefaciens DSM 7 = ATCC 23350]|jgi:hypothetical protein|nr:hypothetical protein BAMTA208_03685 [Bacillus amyloliquefaciens TA208]AEK87920.1 hypothetical protein BAXH7_00775 [Bacillus amyloliquefaciens XH7]AIW32807.1 hypothetical protein KS08_03775 [Bacillus subtilis]MDR4378278.1 hypothetical protein [Bacillus amyloliquefaciens]OXL18295.1 hypothetical protein CFI04_18055 [Bacillus amyloliquefaciens]
MEQHDRTLLLNHVTALGIDLKNEGFRTFFQLFSSVKIKFSEKRQSGQRLPMKKTRKSARFILPKSRSDQESFFN